MKVFYVLAAALIVGTGCNSGTTSSQTVRADDPDLLPERQEKEGEKKHREWPEGVVIHRNAKGEVECPVMHSVVVSPEKAVGFQDHEGKRYYFCCDMCPEKFKKDPALYADKPPKPTDPSK